MVDYLAYQVAAFMGAVLAIAFGAIAPYYKKWIETKEVTGDSLKFDKKFAVTAGISFVFSVIAGLLAFQDIESGIDYNATIIKVFATAFISGVAANFGLNAFMKPSGSLLKYVRELKTQNSELRRLNKQS